VLNFLEGQNEKRKYENYLLQWCYRINACLPSHLYLTGEGALLQG